MRQLNKAIQKYFLKEKKIIRLSILSKIIEETEKRFENPEKDTVMLSISTSSSKQKSKISCLAPSFVSLANRLPKIKPNT